MQVSNKKPKRSSRLELLVYLCLGGVVYFAFNAYQGKEFEQYAIHLTQKSEPPVDLESSPEVKALIDAAVARALQDANHEPSSSSSLPATPTTPKSFKKLGDETGTDKTMGHDRLPLCLKDDKECVHPEHENALCRVWGHFYDTIYERWLGPYATGDIPMQLLEIGYYRGQGFEAYTKYLEENKAAELHTMEISCIEQGPREEGKWPWGNFASKHRWYKDLVQKDRLHCGDASDYNFLKEIWETKMKRPGAPPLKVVIDDASHLHDHMATSLFFWFPRIEPGGILVVEDIQPQQAAAKFRTHIMPQVMKDLHWCGGSGGNVMSDSLCFPTIQPFLFGVHCELHICVFVRNDKPAIEPSKEDSLIPPHAFDDIPKCLFK